MKTVRLSPSKIEQFRKHYKEEYNGTITKESVIDSLLGRTVWKKQMDFGTAYHGLIEHGGNRFWNEKMSLYEVKIDQMKEPIFYTPNEARPAIDYHQKYIGCVNEMKWEHEIIIGNYRILIPMRLDMMYGNEVHEIKTTSRNIDMETYMKSMQWMIYLISTNAKFVQYDIFKYTKKKNDSEYKIELFDFKFYPESNILSNVRNMALMTLEFALDNGLEISNGKLIESK